MNTSTVVTGRSNVLTCRLIRKRCFCGRQVTARQLKQYSACAKCYAEAVEESKHAYAAS